MSFLSLPHALESHARAKPYATAFEFFNNGQSVARRSYAQLLARAYGIAATLRSRCQVGDRAALLFPGGIEFIEAFFGCLFAGVIPVPLLAGASEHDAERLESFLADATPRILLGPASIAAKLGRLAALTSGGWLDPATLEPAPHFVSQ